MSTAQNFDAPETAPAPWEQQPGEPAIWYARFKLYLQLGPLRTYHAVYCQAQQMNKRKTPSAMPEKAMPGKWSTYARCWRWRERAQAWDTEQRNLLALSERNVRLALHHRRVNLIEDNLERVGLALDNAHLEDADEAQARAWLPQLRVFLRDLLAAERQEFERLADDKQDADNAVLITADDLRAAQRAMEAEEAQARPARQTPGEPSTSASAPKREATTARRCTFLVCAGPDSELLLDLAALRAVRAATGLRFQRLLNATPRKLDDTLRRQRSLGHPIEYLHLAVHASAAGLELVDGLIDGNWLSERLEGVRVLLLASCTSDGIGDWLGVVPYVISLSEDIPNEDAATLAQHFWQGIGQGKEPGAALDAALAQCPPAVGEYVVRHW